MVPVEGKQPHQSCPCNFNCLASRDVSIWHAMGDLHPVQALATRDWGEAIRTAARTRDSMKIIPPTAACRREGGRAGRLATSLHPGSVPMCKIGRVRAEGVVRRLPDRLIGGGRRSCG